MWLIVGLLSVPRWRSSRPRAMPRTARQTATLLVSTPSSGVIGGRRLVGVRELDTGITTTSSVGSGSPVRSSSADTMTAGRCLAGSPGRPAPKATSHSSPRRGLVDSIGVGLFPVAVLLDDGWVGGFCAGGGAFLGEGGVPFGAVGPFVEECDDGDAAVAGLCIEAITSGNRYADRCCRCRHDPRINCRQLYLQGCLVSSVQRSRNLGHGEDGVASNAAWLGGAAAPSVLRKWASTTGWRRTCADRNAALPDVWHSPFDLLSEMGRIAFDATTARQRSVSIAASGRPLNNRRAFVVGLV